MNNFDEPSIPDVLVLPPGTGAELKADMEQLIEDLRTSLSSAFESEEYQTRQRRTLEEEFQERQQESLKGLQEKAKEQGFALLRTPSGLAFAPMRDDEVMPPEEFQKLPQEEQDKIQAGGRGAAELSCSRRCSRCRVGSASSAPGCTICNRKSPASCSPI